MNTAFLKETSNIIEDEENLEMYSLERNTEHVIIISV